MRNCYKILVAAILIAFSVSSFAGQWRCTSYSGSHGYSATSSNAQAAMKKSMKACLKYSHHKRNCNITPSNCHRVRGY